MRASLFLACLASGLVLALGDGFTSTTTFKPESCDRSTKKGDTLDMHYTGKIAESSETGVKGKVFDSSLTRGQPFTFAVGSGQVIKGWDEGLLDMCIGEKRTLLLPPEFGYGDRGAGADIPGGATLEFTVELIGIKDSPPQPNIYAEIDADKDGFVTKEELTAWFSTTRGMDKIPDGLWDQEDKDKDGKISWEEFGGPKGTSPPGQEDGKEL